MIGPFSPRELTQKNPTETLAPPSSALIPQVPFVEEMIKGKSSQPAILAFAERCKVRLSSLSLSLNLFLSLCKVSLNDHLFLELLLSRFLGMSHAIFMLIFVLISSVAEYFGRQLAGAAVYREG